MKTSFLLSVILFFLAVYSQAQIRQIHVKPDIVDCVYEDTVIHVSNVKDAFVKAELLIKSNLYTEDEPLIITIDPGVYWLDDPDDDKIRRPLPGDNIPYALKTTLNHTHIKGLSKNPEDVVIACNRGQTQGADGNFTLLHITGDDIWFENITLGNYCNVDLVYKRDSSQNRARRAVPIVQAQLAICSGDKYVARNCRFISRLNLCPLVGARRVLFDNCYFESTDDALCGSGVYLNCKFTFFSGKPFFRTDWEGARFLNCDIYSKTNGRQYLVKSGSPVSMVDCRWFSDDPCLFVAWTQNPTDDLRSYQFNQTLNGKKLLIGSDNPHLTVDMTDKEILRAYKDHGVYNIFNLLKGNDGWNPLQQDTTSLYKSDTFISLNHKFRTIETGKDTIHLRASSPDVFWSVAEDNDKFVKLKKLKDGTCIISAHNQTELPENVNIIARTVSGLETACVLKVIPPILPAPIFSNLPSIENSNGVATVNYKLDLGLREDKSLITWYRSSDPMGISAFPVAVSGSGSPKKSYMITDADDGFFIMAEVKPRHLRSHTGEGRIAITHTRMEKGNHINELTTDFSDFPTFCQKKIIKGFWTVDAFKPSDTSYYEWNPNPENAWTYGHGVDGASQSKGLVQVSRGARIMYNPPGYDFSDMTLSLDVDPCKTAGQGFGSATGQYMDVYIKFDPVSLSGYGLRIERTVKNDKAVDFCLMQYDHGVSTKITLPVSAVCFRTGCHIFLEMKGDILSVKVTNKNLLPEPPNPDVLKNVEISTHVQKNKFGGIGIQHTGTTGSGASVLKYLKVKWE